MYKAGASGLFKAHPSASFLPWLTVGLLVLTFFCDLVTPRDVALWPLYLPAIGFALLWKGRWRLFYLEGLYLMIPDGRSGSCDCLVDPLFCHLRHRLSKSQS